MRFLLVCALLLWSGGALGVCFPVADEFPLAFLEQADPGPLTAPCCARLFGDGAAAVDSARLAPPGEAACPRDPAFACTAARCGHGNDAVSRLRAIGRQRYCSRSLRLLA